MTSKQRIHVSRGKGLGAAVIGLLLLMPHTPEVSHAQENRTSGNPPDLSGIWNQVGLAEPDVPLPMTARAIGFSLAFDEVMSPRYDCSPAAAPFLLRDPYNFRMEQHDDRVTLFYEKDDVVRTVWLEGFGHPEPGPYDFTIQGHSRGWYEGDHLVVETSKFTFDPIGLGNSGTIPSTTMKKVTERYWREGNRLIARVTTEDPPILLEPYEFTFVWELTDVELVAYNCIPEEARFPAQFQVKKYMEPDWVRLPATDVATEGITPLR